MPKILCVDDHEETCQVLTVLLSRTGHEVKGVAHAGEARGEGLNVLWQRRI